MKRFLRIACLVLSALPFAAAPAFAESYVEMLRAARSNDQIIEALYQLSYYGNKSCFWDFVKYLNYAAGEDEGSNAPLVRKAAAEALGRSKDERGVKHLAERYRVEKKDDVKMSIVFALSFHSGAEVSSVIKNALASQNTDLRYQAVLAAEKTGAKEMIPDIKTIFSTDKDDTLRMVSAFALYSFGEDRAADEKYLVNGLHSSDPLVRYRAADYIGRAGIDSAAGEVIKAIEIENKWWVKAELDRAMDRIREVQKKKRDAEIEQSYKFLDTTSSAPEPAPSAAPSGPSK